MKYGLIPTSLSEYFAIWAGKVPVPAIDVIFSLIKARSLMAGVSLGIFEELKDLPLTPDEIAAQCRLDTECTEILLRTLASVGYLEQTGNKYSLSELSRQTMISGAKGDLSGYIQWNYTQWEMIGHLEDLIRTGKGIDFHQTMNAPEQWATYQQAMLEVARFQAPVVADKVPVKSGALRLLDLAGSHGLIGATICRLHPPMKSEVLDLPEAIGHAQTLAQSEQIDDIVTHRAGNLLLDNYGNDYDVVLASNILHHFNKNANLEILRRIYDSLNENGTVAIWEIEAPDKTAKANATDGAVLFFRLTSNARCYTGDDYTQWLEDTGFTQIKVTRPLLAQGFVLVTARRET